MQKYEKKTKCVINGNLYIKIQKPKAIIKGLIDKVTYRIAMAVTNDIATDGRLLRHAAALTEAGHEVILIGRELPWSQPLRLPYKTLRMKLSHRKGWRFYAEYNRRLTKELRRLKADIVWANDTDTLSGCWMASKVNLHPARLVMDAHELFPEVPEIQHKPLVRWVWRMIERMLLPQCDTCLTVCDSIADYYRQTLGVQMTVVRNMSNQRTAASGQRKREVTTLLYQGAVNMGRGVDWAIDAMEWLPDCRLVVAGGGDLLKQMRAYAAEKPWSDRVEFLGPVSLEKLHELTPQADVGLVMLEDMGLSYHFALPNRIGDFVAAGVPMVVSDLPEMARVVKRYKVGEVMREPGAQALAESVKRVLTRQWSDNDFAAARRDMDWNKEKAKLVECVNSIMCK